MITRLRRRPERVAVPPSDAAPEGVVVVNEELMRQGLAQILLNRQLAAGAPLLIHWSVLIGATLLLAFWAFHLLR